MSDAPTTYSITARSTKGGTASATAKNERIEFDASRGPGGDLPGPAELLLTAFSACTLKNLERISKMLPFHYEAASMQVEGERQSAPPKFIQIRYTLKIVTDQPDKLDLVHKNLSRYGTITNTLAEACELEGEIVDVEVVDEL